jgi:hypothetical protein
MPKAATTIKKGIDQKVVPPVVANNDDDLIITPQQYEAITAANRDCPISKLALRMFLHVNYLWHIARAMHGTWVCAHIACSDSELAEGC